MVHVVLFHAVRGLGDGERAAAERLRAAGSVVTLPDLLDGARTETIEEGLALSERIGWDTVAARAEAAAADTPADAVLGGISYGAGVAAHLWAQRPETAGVLFLHGPGEIPEAPRPGTPVQFHLAEPDPYEEEEFIADWIEEVADRDLAFEAFRYPGVGHLFSDPSHPDHDPAAAATLWRRVDAFLARL